jgi:hypothetical protein
MKKLKINYSGQKINKLTFIEYLPNTKGKWLLECECGKNVQRHPNTVIKGNIKSCGHKDTPYRKDLNGLVVHWLTVIGYDRQIKKKSYWKCLCKCGTIKSYSSDVLGSGRLYSCGCYCRKICSERIGSKHHNYNYSLTETERTDRRQYAEYKIWRKKAYELHNYTCFVCNKRGGKLVIHHIQNYCNNPSLRLDLKNSVCLCNSCHDLFHKINGKKNNDLYQLINFKNTYHQYYKNHLKELEAKTTRDFRIEDYKIKRKYKNLQHNKTNSEKDKIGITLIPKEEYKEGAD